jgi:hypothetical protein
MVHVSYFVIKFETSRIFHHFEDEMIKFHYAFELPENIAIRAELLITYFGNDKIVCEIVNVIEGADWITQIAFKCDSSVFDSKIEEK